jgi:hypothetical protein
MLLFVALALVTAAAGTASAFIAFPYNFSNGTPADATQVNANFQAVNAKQTATLARMAGTYAMQGTDFYTETRGVFGGTGYVEMTCTDLSRGTLTLRADGSFTLISTTDDSCHHPNSGTMTGTYSVDGVNNTGTMVFPNKDTISFRISRDLNVIMWEHTTNQQGIAMRL